MRRRASLPAISLRAIFRDIGQSFCWWTVDGGWWLVDGSDRLLSVHRSRFTVHLFSLAAEPAPAAPGEQAEQHGAGPEIPGHGLPPLGRGLRSSSRRICSSTAMREY